MDSCHLLGANLDTKLTYQLNLEHTNFNEILFEIQKFCIQENAFQNVVSKGTAILSQSQWTLTHWGRVTHTCVSKLTIIGSDNGLSPSQRQAIIWTNAWILLIRPSGTNFSKILIAIDVFSFKKMHLKMSSAKWRPSCIGLNVLSVIAFVECYRARPMYMHLWFVIEAAALFWYVINKSGGGCRRKRWLVESLHHPGTCSNLLLPIGLHGWQQMNEFCDMLWLWFCKSQHPVGASRLLYLQ